MILMLKAKHIFKMFFFKIRLKYFHDNLHTVLILAPGREFFLLNVRNFL